MIRMMPHRASVSGLKLNREVLAIGTLSSQMCMAGGLQAHLGRMVPCSMALLLNSPMELLLAGTDG